MSTYTPVSQDFEDEENSADPVKEFDDEEYSSTQFKEDKNQIQRVPRSRAFEAIVYVLLIVFLCILISGQLKGILQHSADTATISSTTSDPSSIPQFIIQNSPHSTSHSSQPSKDPTIFTSPPAPSTNDDIPFRIANITESHQSEEFPKRKLYHRDSWVIFPKHKLMMCAFPKAGCTTLQKLAKQLEHPDEKCKFYGCSKPERLQMGVEYMNRMLRNQSWTKAVFLRDPRERLLSAYRNKCEDLDKCCDHCPFVNHWHPTYEFDKFVERMQTSSSRLWVRDEHWKPQTRLCGPFTQITGFFDFIGVLSDPGSVYDQMKQLQNLSLHLQTERMTQGIEQFYSLESLREWQKLQPNEKYTRSDTIYEEYFTPLASKMAFQIYKEDYDVIASLVQHPGATLQFKERFKDI